METEIHEKNPHCLVLPFPLQGHINPMLQFSKRLKHKGIRQITLVLTKSFIKSAQDNLSASTFQVETISDGLQGINAESLTPEERYNRFRDAGSETLSELVRKLRTSGSGLTCLIYDPFFPWALDVAKRFGLTAAVFFTQSNSVNSIYLCAYRGELKVPVEEEVVRIAGGLPELERSDLPSFIGDYESDPESFKLMTKQFKNVERADWVLVNTFYDMEKEVTDYMSAFLPMRPIGPTIPSMYLDKRVLDDQEYGLSIFKPMTDHCIKWLDKQKSGSVIYVSFGSFAEPKVEQIEELALALKMTNLPFLWVVRASEEAKLPENYTEEMSEKGLIVTWCPQLQVLSHEAIGCFVTHCGWNSTLEALSSGVPMVTMPQWSDQSTNAKFVADVWKMGLRVNPDEKGIVGKEQIRNCIERVVKEVEGGEMRKNARKWKDLARNAVDEGGSSDRNIEEFVSTLMNL